jgi:hypothetical protein
MKADSAFTATDDSLLARGVMATRETPNLASAGSIPAPPANLMKITKVQVKALPAEWSYCPDRCYGQVLYEAEAIEHRGYYFYRVGKRVIIIEKWEYERVRKSAVLHYFTTALKLHYRLGLEPGSPLYEVWKAVELPKVN